MAFGGRGLDIKVLVAVILMTVATLFQLIGLASDNWVNTVSDEHGVIGSSGLWRVCTSFGDAFGLPNDRCRGFVWTDNQVSHWFRTVQTFEVLGFVFGCVALFMMLLFHFVETCMENTRLKFFSIILLVLSFIFVLVGAIVLGSLKDVQKSMTLESYAQLSWGFGFSLTASLLYLVCVFAVIVS